MGDHGTDRVKQHLSLLEMYRNLPLVQLGAQERLLLFSAIKDRLQRALLAVDTSIKELQDLLEEADI